MPRLYAPLPPGCRLLTRAERGRRRPKPKRKGKPTTRQDKGREYFIESDATYRDTIRSRLDLRRMQVGAPREEGAVGVSHLWSDYRVAWEKATILHKEDLLYALPPLCFFPPSLPVSCFRKFNLMRGEACFPGAPERASGVPGPSVTPGDLQVLESAQGSAGNTGPPSHQHGVTFPHCPGKSQCWPSGAAHFLGIYWPHASLKALKFKFPQRRRPLPSTAGSRASHRKQHGTQLNIRSPAHPSASASTAASVILPQWDRLMRCSPGHHRV